MDAQDIALTRRGFMVGAAGLSFGFATGDAFAANMKAVAKDAVINPWVTIATDGTISIMSPAAEMGQGSLTSLPLILAEELDADWRHVRVVPAPPINAIFKNPAYGFMYTSGSNAVRAYWKPVRQFGAQVRKVLLANAAKHWSVDVAELTTAPSVVIHAKSGRRLGYSTIAGFAEIPAIAPAVADSELKPASQFRLIGKDVMRVDMPGKVNGTARYSIDVEVPGMLYGAVLRAPVEGAAPQTVGDAKAKAIPGVVKVVPLSDGVGVIATTPTAAFKAKNALEVTWSRDGKGWSFDTDSGGDAFAAAARDVKTPGMVWDKKGDVAAGLESAPHVIEAEYRCDFVYHAQMEPLNAVASVAPDGGSLELWSGTQSKTNAVDMAAKTLGITLDKITYHDMLMGGGFGRRGHRDQEYVHDAVALSNAVKKPVKVMWTREDDVRNGRFYPLSAHYLRIGYDDTGKLLAMHHRKACDQVYAFQDPPGFVQGGKKDRVSYTGIEFKHYDMPNRLAEVSVQDSGIRGSSLRAVSHLSNIFAIESILDDIARQQKIDPVAYRIALIGNAPRSRKIIETVAEMANWGRKRNGTALGVAFMDFAGTLTCVIVEASLDRKTGAIRVHNAWVALDPGITVQPDSIIAQTEGSIVWGLGYALSERITIKNGVVQQSNFTDYHVPRMNEVPEIHVQLIRTDNEPTGVGEVSMPLVAPAIGNAVAALTGVRLRAAPMTKDRVLAALKA
jgi:isoquinoline 1-oxidoreductase beta subunit